MMVYRSLVAAYRPLVVVAAVYKSLVAAVVVYRSLVEE
jgi:hypothetical protein